MDGEVIYLGHSAWCVKSKTHWFIFDYQKGISSKEGLEKGLVNLTQLRDQPVIFFASHVHHDHFSKEITLKIGDEPKSVYVIGDFESREPGCVTMRPYEKREIDGVSIRTGASTDCGVCFLVRGGGTTIFHAGDHADWGDDDTDVSYYDEIDGIAEQGEGIDIAFVPVCTYSGQRPDSMTKGALYAIEKLKPRIVFPMHGNGREHLYKAFEQDARHMLPGQASRIVCMEKEGDVFRLSPAAE